MSPGKTDQKRGKDSHLTCVSPFWSIIGRMPSGPAAVSPSNSNSALSTPNMSAPPRRCWVGNAASSVCAVGQRTHPVEVQSEPHLPSNVVLGQLVTEQIGLENGIVLSFSS